MSTEETMNEEGVTRRDALRKAAAIGAVAGVAWSAPAVNGMSIVPGFASAGSVPPLPQISVSGTATKTLTLGCFSGAGGDDQWLQALGGDGWWHFYFQGCSAGNTESVALADPPGGPVGNAYEPPTGYKCKFNLTAPGDPSTVRYSTGYVTNPINGIADTGGVVFIGTAAYPNGYGNMGWNIICDPL